MNYTEIFVNENKDTGKGARSLVHSSADQAEWSAIRLFIFRVAFAFFLILILPWYPRFYELLLDINWLHPHFKKLVDLTAYLPDLIDSNRYGFSSLLDLGIFLLISLVIGSIWTYFAKSRKNHRLLNYLLVAVLRYRIGIGLIAYGFYLFFQQYFPYPSLSNLHTNYGDLFAWKVYFQTTAINPEYESFLGFVEIVTGLLILCRRTTTIGAGIALGFLGNVFMVNLYYDVGQLPYITFLLLGVLYLFHLDIPRLYDLLIAGKKTSGKRFHPEWHNPLIRKFKHVGLIIVAIFMFFLIISGYPLINAPFKYPQTPGITGTKGYYQVTDFVLNGETIPYSLTDTSRWQDVIFEAWTTLSIKVNKPITVDVTDGDKVEKDDFHRNYEIAGAGGREYYHYSYDSLSHKLLLVNKNQNYPNDKWELEFNRLSDTTILLKGVNGKHDSVSAKLLRIDKKYFMYEGRRSRIEL